MTTTTIECDENFKVSNNEGKHGEAFFYNRYGKLYSDNENRLIDISETNFGHKHDVDFVEKIGECVNKKIEVKVDKRCDGFSFSGKNPTGNLTYELLSHGQLGWSVKTQADVVVFILGNCNYRTKEFSITRTVFVDMNKWRNYLLITPKSVCWLKEEHQKSAEDEIADLRYSVDELVSAGVIIGIDDSVFGEKINFNEKL